MDSPSVSPLSGVFTCPVCSGIHTNPVLLPCFHVICEACVNVHIDRQGQDTSEHSFPCPVCEYDLQLTDSVVTKFPKDSFVENVQKSAASQKNLEEIECNGCGTPGRWRCMDCEQTLCHACIKPHDAVTHAVSELCAWQTATIALLAANNKEMCPKHDEHEVQLQCTECNVAICLTCFTKDHLDHPIKNITEAGSEAKTKLSTLLQDVKSMNTNLRDRFDRQNSCIENLTASKSGKIAEIREHRNKCVRILNEHFEKLEDDFTSTTAASMYDLKLSIKNISTRLTRVNALIDYGAAMNKYGRHSETIQTLLYMEAVMGSLPRDPLDTKPQVSETYFKRGTLDSTNAGEIFGTCSGISINLDNGDQNELEGESSTTSEQAGGTTVSVDEMPSDTSLTSIVNKPNTVPKPKRLFSDNVVDTKKDPSPLYPDLTTVNAAAAESEVHLYKPRLVAQCSVQRGPWGLTFTSAGYVVVGSPQGVDIYNTDGQKRLQFVRPVGIRKWHPVNVARGVDDALIVSNWESAGDGGGLYKFSTQGRCLSVLVHMSNPRGVAVADDGAMAVVSGGSRDGGIDIFNDKGHKLYSSRNDDKDSIPNPHYVAISQKCGDVVVTHSNGITAFTSKLIRLWTYKANQEGPGNLINPRGVAITLHGDIFVADGDAGNIVSLTSDGNFVDIPVRKDIGLGRLQGIAISEEGYLAIANWNKDKLFIMKIDQSEESIFLIKRKLAG